MHPLHNDCSEPPLSWSTFSFSTEFFRSVDCPSVPEKPQLHPNPGNSAYGCLLANIFFNSMTFTLSYFLSNTFQKLLLLFEPHTILSCIYLSPPTHRGLFRLIPPGLSQLLLRIVHPLSSWQLLHGCPLILEQHSNQCVLSHLLYFKKK